MEERGEDVEEGQSKHEFGEKAQPSSFRIPNSFREVLREFINGFLVRAVILARLGVLGEVSDGVKELLKRRIEGELGKLGKEKFLEVIGFRESKKIREEIKEMGVLGGLDSLCTAVGLVEGVEAGELEEEGEDIPDDLKELIGLDFGGL